MCKSVNLTNFMKPFMASNSLVRTNIINLFTKPQQGFFIFIFIRLSQVLYKASFIEHQMTLSLVITWDSNLLVI